MSTTIDQKVVEMQFDNRNFETNVQTSLGTLDKLKSSLNFDSVTDALSPLTSKLGGLGDKFSVMEVAAISAIQRVTNELIDMTEKLGKAMLGIDDMQAGWAKFGDKTTSVSTLLAQGFGIDEVTEQLDRLNWFTDETSYNFVDMVGNIGKFTAAGQGLTDSVTAMEGIANWAALSGQNATTASRAMYQLSQAMSAGVMRKEDYRSIQNANMDTKEFRQNCLDAAAALGTVRKNADGTYTSIAEGGKSATFTIDQFANNLTETGWLTSDVMMQVFQKYSSAVDQIYDYSEEKGITASEAIEELGDGVDAFGLKAFKAAQQARTWRDVLDSIADAVSTGWMTTFELVFGNAEEATQLWTDLANALYDVFMASTEVRNGILEIWKDNGGREKLIDAFWTLWDAVGAVSSTIKEAFGKIFNTSIEKSANSLLNLTDKIQKLSKALTPSEETLDKIRRIAEGIFAAFDILKNALVMITMPLRTVFGMFDIGSLGILDMLANFGDMIVGFDRFTKSHLTFVKVGQKLQNVVKDISKYIGELKNKFSDFISGLHFEFWDKIVEKFNNFKDSLSDTSITIDLRFSNIKEKLSGVAQVLTKVADVLSTAFSKIKDAVKELFKDKSMTDAMDLIKGGTLVTAGASITKFFNSFSSIDDVTYKFSKVLGIVGNEFKSFQKNMNSQMLLTIAIAIGILTASVIALSMIDAERLVTALGIITAEMTELFMFFESMSRFDNMKSNKVIKQFIKLGVAMLIMAEATKIFASIDADKVTNGLIAVGSILAEFVVFSKFLDSSNMTGLKGAVFVELALAVLVLSKAVENFADLSWEELGKGLGSVAVLMALLSKSIDGIDGTKMASAGLSMLLISASILVMSSAIKSLGSMDLMTLGTGLLAFATTLGIVTMAMNALPDNMGSKSASLILASAAIVILGEALKIFGSLNINELTIGLVGMAGALAELVIAMELMNGSIAGAGAMLVAAAALTVLGGALKIFGSMSWGELLVGLVGIAGAIAILAVSAAALTPILPAMLGLSAALALLGVAAVSVGAGVMMLSAGLASLAVSGVAGVGALIIVIKEILGLIPSIAKYIALAIVEIIKVIGKSAPEIIRSVGDILEAILQALINNIPKFIEFIDVLLKSIVEHLPSIIDAFMQFATELVEGVDRNLDGLVDAVANALIHMMDKIAEKAPELINAAIDLAFNLIEGFAQGIEDNADKLNELIISVFKHLWEAVLKLLGIHSPSTVFADIGKNVILGFIEGFTGLASSAYEKAKTFVTNVISKFTEKMSQFATKGREMMTNVKSGIDNASSSVKNAASNVMSNVLSAVRNKVSEFSSIGRNLIHGLRDGINDAANSVVESAKGVVNSAVNAAKNLLGIHSPSKVFAEIGKFTDMGFAQGLMSYVGKVTDASERVGQNAIDSMSSVLAGLSDDVGSDMDLNPVITPILDLSNVTANANKIGSLLNVDKPLNLASGINVSDSSNAGTIQNATNDLSVILGEDLKNLRADVSDLAKAISKMRIVMDSGTLVGAITDDIDAALGNRLALVGRGV